MSGEGAKRRDEIIEALLAQGWSITKTKRGHFRCCSPDKSQPPMTLGGTPNGAAIRNMISDLKRRGAVL